jgi:membrane-bound lytic murein transglycosylase D
MARWAVAAIVIFAAACGRQQIETGPAPRTGSQAGADTPQGQVLTRTPRTAAQIADSAAEAELLDSLQQLEPGSLPELTFDDLNEPRWDINVERFSSHPRVQYYLDFFTGRGRKAFQVWLDRMPRFESYARMRLQEQGLPSDLVYLALIESGFSPVAVSRAKAVGMWQFMAATGRGYGLRIDTWLDERRDPIKSTDAAARMLKALTDRFGSHFLAAAAYNRGEGRVGRGLLRVSALQGAGDETIDLESDEMFFELAETPHLYQETKDYVPKLIAAAMIAKAPERYDFDPPAEVEPFPLDSVMVDGNVGLDLIAELADTSLDALRELNPHLLRGITPPGQTYPVRVPTGTAERIATAYASIPPSERVRMITHVVRRGETVSGIARRYGVSTDLVMTANRVARARSLQVGTTLYIPVNGAIPDAMLREPEPASRAPVTHIVRRGETLSGIARRYAVSQASLREANKLPANGAIRAGQKLTITGSTNSSSASTASSTPRVHVVRAGETVGQIAQRYNVSQSRLIRENNLGSRAMIRVGQRLTIPG